MKKLISSLEWIFGVILFLTLLGGVIMVFGFIIALIIGGGTATAMSVFIQGTLLKWLAAATTIDFFLGLVVMYLRHEKAMTVENSES